MASGTNTRSNNVIEVAFAPAQTGDCISDKMAREIARRLTATVRETSTPGDAVVSRTPPNDTSKIWYPADANGFPIGTAYKFDPLQGQWISTAVVPQPPPCRSTNDDSLIGLDSQGCWSVSRQQIETIAQNVGLKVSSNSGNALKVGSDGGLYVEVADTSNDGQLEILSSPVVIAGTSDSVGPIEYDLNDLPGITVPVWATHAIIRSTAQLFTNNLNANSTNKAYAKVNLVGKTVVLVGPTVGPNNQVDTAGDNTNDTYALLDESRLNYQFILNKSPSWSASDQANFTITLCGFIRAGII